MSGYLFNNELGKGFPSQLAEGHAFWIDNQQNLSHIKRLRMFQLALLLAFHQEDLKNFLESLDSLVLDQLETVHLLHGFQKCLLEHVIVDRLMC